MKNRILFLFLILIVFSFNNKLNYVFAKNLNFETSAKGMVVLESNTDTVLYEKNKDKKLPMASTTKIVTAIIALEKCTNLDEKFQVSDKSIGIEGTSIYLKSGEHLSMKELLYGLILASGNDCAIAIAERLGGTETFVGYMNELVEKLNLNNTHFDNPHGLDSHTHYTSAYDLAKLTSYGLKNEYFKELLGTKRMVINKSDKYQARYLKNKNRLLFTSDNCIGGKTGFTDNARRCLVSIHEENDMEIVTVLLNCQPMFDDCQKLVDISIKNYIMKDFIQPYNYVCDISVIESEKSEVGIITIKGFKLPILKEDEDRYEVKYEIPKSIKAPIKLNEIVGTVKVFKDNKAIFEDSLITIESAKNNDIKYMLDNIIDKWF